METLAGVVSTVVDALTAAGISATDDQRTLEPPAVYVTPPIITWSKLTGYSAALDLYVVVPAAGRHEALTALGPLVDRVRDVWPARDGFPVDLAPLDGVDPLPAYRLPITLEVSP